MILNSSTLEALAQEVLETPGAGIAASSGTAPCPVPVPGAGKGAGELTVGREFTFCGVSVQFWL